MKHTISFTILFFFFCSIFLLSCEKIVEIDLPPIESQLVVESYIEPNLPYILSLTQSTSYFDVGAFQSIGDAEVTITHLGKTDTLVYIDSLNFYIGTSGLVKYDEFPYTLEVEDGFGRKVSATTSFKDIVQIDTITYSLNDSSQASVIMFFDDQKDIENYYHVWFDNSESNDPDSLYHWSFSDKSIANQRSLRGTGFNFDQKDTITVRLYNIQKDFYDYLDTVNDAINANGSPLGRAARIESNIEGGLGIFTALSFDEEQIILE
ncbi:MAG: DUF4249 domain-containing protein [Chitinophagales bacterium]